MNSSCAKPCFTKTPTNNLKEYKYFDKNYFIKVNLDVKNNTIIIVCYDITEFENKRYELKVTKTDLINMNKLFKIYDKIEEIYEVVYKIFETKNYKIINLSNDDKLVLELKFSINLDKNDINFIISLNLELNTNGDFNSDYIYILRNELINLKKQHEKEIFDLKNQNQIIIKELKAQKQLINDLLNNNINNNNNNSNNIINIQKNHKNSKELILKGKQVDNKILMSLEKYAYLEKLDLSENNITDINILEKCRFKQLKILNLSINQIQDLSVLKLFQFQKLSELYLNQNKIYNLEPLSKIDLTHLQRLNLSYNYIEDINTFYRINAPQLKYLNLSHNEIDDITVLGTVQFNDLKELYLDNNKINLELNRDLIEHLVNKITKFTYI